MSYISKVKLKYQLQQMGIKVVEGNYVRKSEIRRILASDIQTPTKEEIEANKIYDGEILKPKEELQSWTSYKFIEPPYKVVNPS